jgi:hypothetical protein
VASIVALILNVAAIGVVTVLLILIEIPDGLGLMMLTVFVSAQASALAALLCSP